MLIRKCDRCGAAYDDYFDKRKDSYNAIKTADVRIDNSSWIRTTFDICPECKKSFHAWLMESDKIVEEN